MNVDIAYSKVCDFKAGSLKTHISTLEEDLKEVSKATLESLYPEHGVDPTLLHSALILKQASAQINEVVHAAGILLSLPYILRDGETVESLSLAAGNTGRSFDLETDLRVAEFKFIAWQGASDAVRQDSLFRAFFSLAEAGTPKDRYLYVVGSEHPLRFLNGRRALSSVMGRSNRLWERFQNLYRERFFVVRDYYTHKKNSVEIVDLAEVVPYFATAANRCPDDGHDAPVG
jgi:hypothetical protein